MGKRAKRDAGFLLRQVQQGGKLSMPQSRPMSSIGTGCHELRVGEKDQTWRVIYHVAKTEVVVLDVVKKQTSQTPKAAIRRCKERLNAYRGVK